MTSSDLKQDRLFFRESVSTFLQLVVARILLFVTGLFIGFLVKKLLPLVRNPISESTVTFENELHFTLLDAPGGYTGFQVQV